MFGNDFITFLAKIALLFAAGLVPLMLGGKIAGMVQSKIGDWTKGMKKSSMAKSRGGSYLAARRKEKEDAANLRARSGMQKRASMFSDAIGSSPLGKTSWGRRMMDKQSQKSGRLSSGIAKDYEDRFSRMGGSQAKRLIEDELKKPEPLRDRNLLLAGGKRMIDLDEIEGETLGKVARAVGGRTDSTNDGFNLIMEAEKRRPGVANNEHVAAFLDDTMLGKGKAFYDDSRWPSVQENYQAIKAKREEYYGAVSAGDTARAGTLKQELDALREKDPARSAFSPLGRANRFHAEKEFYPDQLGQGDDGLRAEQKYVLTLTQDQFSKWNTFHYRQAFNGYKGEVSSPEHDAYYQARTILEGGGSLEDARAAAVRAGHLALAAEQEKVRTAAARGETYKPKLTYNNFLAFNPTSQMNMIASMAHQYGVEIRPNQGGGGPAPRGGGGGNVVQGPWQQPPGGGGNAQQPPAA